MDAAVQQTLMQQKTADILANASGAVLALAASVREVRDETLGMSGKHVKQLSIEMHVVIV